MEQPTKQYNRECSYCFSTVSYNKGGKPEECPFCGATNFLKPPTEAKLFKLQHLYFEARKESNKVKTDKYLGELFFLLKEYAEGKIKKKIKYTVSYGEEKLDEKSEEVAVWFLESYMTDPDFVVEQSFGGLLEGKVLKALYNEKEKRNDAILSLDAPLNENDEQHVMELIDRGDLVGSFFDHNSFYDEFLLRQAEGNDLITSIEKVVNEMLKKVKENYGLRSQIYFLVGVYARIAGKRDEEMEDYYALAEKSYTQDSVNSALAIILKLIKDNIEYRGFYDKQQQRV